MKKQCAINMRNRAPLLRTRAKLVRIRGGRREQIWSKTELRIHARPRGGAKKVGDPASRYKGACLKSQ